MKKKTERAYFNGEWQQMEAYLDAFFESGDQEKLHRFRVQVKKLRAMLTLLDTATATGKLTKDFKPVRKIFKKGGHIREAYINLQLARRYFLQDETFILGQVNDMDQRILDFKANAKKYLKIIREVHDKLENDLKALGNEDINEFYKKNLNQISGALTRIQFNDRLHDCRKKIKMLVYNRKIAKKALEGNLSLNEDYLDKLQDCIGDWHDNVMAIELFSAHIATAKPIITKIKRQNTGLRKSINLLARDFISRATFDSNEQPAKQV
ncbi:MAG: CHAD domain-containing protein [Bacteroidetes bacterium]|nr:CHAD domain-containing protein [Bacteroidota bacterium]